MQSRNIDIAILGGGLAGGLIALTLARHRPDLSLLLIERENRLGGNHVWSFFASDVAAADAWLVEPMIAARWDGYAVHFPAHSRDMSTPYRSITSERLDAALRDALSPQCLLEGTEVTAASTTHVDLADGRSIRCGGVIDARGATAMPHMRGGWQKFMGQTLRLGQPHGQARPIVMDARVKQLDGYRFVYTLPFSQTEIFVEDTYYSDTPEIDREALGQRISDYARTRGWQVERVVREETGVLPVIAAGDFEAYWQSGPPVARAGARAALVHPLTSYSLPIAVRFAQHIGKLDDLSGEALAKASYDHAANHWSQGRFYRMLTSMLLGAARPEERYRILQRFYRLPEGLIERFYAGRSSAADCARILAGKPPVPIGAAVASLAGRGRPLASLGEAS